MKIVKRVLLVLLLLILLGAGALAFNFYVRLPKSRPAQALQAPKTAEAIARGRYLASHVTGCLGCHSKIDESTPGDPIVPGHEGVGREFGELEGMPGKIRSPNLTPDPETGLGKWTDGEIVRAVREGIGRDGRPLFPMMPFRTYAETLSDDDTLAIVAFLRTLKPVRNAVGPSEIKFPVAMFVRAVPRPVEKPFAAPPPEGDTLARGQWLLKAAVCVDCHNTVNARREPIEGKYLAGGQAFPVPGKGMVYASNLTADKTTGLGSHTDEDLRRALDLGVNKAGRPLYIMPWKHYGGMTDLDKRALIRAIRAVPAVSHLVPAARLK